MGGGELTFWGRTEIFCQIFRESSAVIVSRSPTDARTTGSWDSSVQRAAAFPTSDSSWEQ
jgi:hypothetical protein